MTRTLNRREFLCAGAGTGVALCAVPTAGASGAPTPAIAEADRLGVLVDVTRCIGCGSCVRACNSRNALPQDPVPATLAQAVGRPLAYDRWTSVTLEAGADSGEGAAASTVARPPVHVKRQCMHCLDPACVSVCPVGALKQNAFGAVIYHQERCIGCRYCVFACPFIIPKFQWDSGATPVIGKCQFCAQHAVFSGPACVTACPTGTLKFGKREDLLHEARARVHARPERYEEKIYGEHEAGGTAWLYLADRPFTQLGFNPRLPLRSLPQLTWMALKVIPAVVVTLAGTLSLLSLALWRRQHRRPAAASGREPTHA